MTQLENQVLGRLQKLEAELILASSVRGDRPDRTGDAKRTAGGAPATQPSPLQREALDAMARRAFNADDIARFKRNGWVGEGRDGLLHLLGGAPATRPADKRLRPLVSEENRDREILMRRVIQLEPDLGRDDDHLVRLIFYRLHVQSARAGEMVQNADGKWVPVEAAGASRHDS